MQFWGLTIDTVNTIILVLAVGLSVDYASHVAHTFMIISGTRYGRFFDSLSLLLLHIKPLYCPLYYYMRNFCNLIGLEQWYFSLI